VTLSNTPSPLTPSAQGAEPKGIPGSSLPRRTAWAARWTIPLYLFLGACAIQVLFLTQFAHSPFFWVPCLDAQYHDIMAQQILKHELAAEPFFRAPAYGYFLAGIYALFGVQNFVAVRVIHALLGSAGVVLLYLLGRRLFSARVGLLAGISMALYGPLIFQLSDLHTTVLEVFCLLVFALLFVRLMEQRSAGQAPLLLAAASGMVIGLWASARPNALLAVPVALAWMHGRRVERKALSVCLAFLTGVLLLPSLITVRNAVVGKDPVFIAWFGGINLYMANQPTCNGMNFGSPKRYHFKDEYEETVALYARHEAETAVGRPLRFSEIDRYWRHRAGDFWRQQPLNALRLAGKKLVLIFTRREIRNVTGFDYFRTEWTPALALAFVGFWYAGPLGLLGIGLAWRTHRPSRPLALLALLYLVHLVLFIAADRYRTAVVPLLLLFAAHAVFVLLDGIRARNWKGLRVPAFALVALAVFVNVDWYQTNPPSDWAKDAWTAGIRYNRLRQYDRAEVQMRKALKLDPADGDIWLGLGESLYYQRKFAEAAACFSEGASRAADASRLLYNLALCHVEMGRLPEARAVLTNLVRRDSDYTLARELLRELDSAAKKP
jgi:4-amino-4-deoxy-L-arabinose transferase-like glycosyltransferase